MTLGHLGATVQAAAEVAVGGTAAVGGGVAALPSGGLSLGASVAGGVAAVHGMSVLRSVIKNINSAAPTNDNTYNRVQPRNGTKQQVKDAQPKNEKGEMLDPHSGQPPLPQASRLW